MIHATMSENKLKGLGQVLVLFCHVVTAWGREIALGEKSWDGHLNHSEIHPVVSTTPSYCKAAGISQGTSKLRPCSPSVLEVFCTQMLHFLLNNVGEFRQDNYPCESRTSSRAQSSWRGSSRSETRVPSECLGSPCGINEGVKLLPLF